MSTASPCVRNCCLDKKDVCIGCGRTVDEIIRWGDADAQVGSTVSASVVEVDLAAAELLDQVRIGHDHARATGCVCRLCRARQVDGLLFKRRCDRRAASSTAPAVARIGFAVCTGGHEDERKRKSG